MAENKWTMAFWIMTVFTMIVGASVIYNDRVRATEDQRVEGIVLAGDKCIVTDIGDKLDRIINQNTETKILLASTLRQVEVNSGRIARIEDKIYPK